MNIQEVKSKLCYYDTRNPNGVIDDMSPEGLTGMGVGPMAKPGCYCDNCFRGRAELANIIVEGFDLILKSAAANKPVVTKVV